MSEEGWIKKESRGNCVDFQPKEPEPTVGQKAWKWLWSDKKDGIKEYCDGEVFRYECKLDVGVEWMVKCEKCDTVYDRGVWESKPPPKKNMAQYKRAMVEFGRSIGRSNVGTTTTTLDVRGMAYYNPTTTTQSTGIGSVHDLINRGIFEGDCVDIEGIDD